MFCTPTQNRQDNILREETKQTSMIDSLNPALETRRRNTTHKNHKRVKKIQCTKREIMRVRRLKEYCASLYHLETFMITLIAAIYETLVAEESKRKES